jgi:hypothetical protein
MWRVTDGVASDGHSHTSPVNASVVPDERLSRLLLKSTCRCIDSSRFTNDTN